MLSNRLAASAASLCLSIVIGLACQSARCETPTEGSQQVTDIKVMSFNIRFSIAGVNEADAADNWSDAEPPRRERAIRVIRQYDPDVLGVQEARELQVNDLREALPEYDFYGVGRDDGKSGGEYVGIFYRKDRFERDDAGTFWLSEEPHKPGTTFAPMPNAVPRISSWVRLSDKRSDEKIFVLNTHWDHVSVPARRKSAELIRQRLEQLAQGAPSIVMGDLNTPEDSAPFRTLVADVSPPARPLFDSYRSVRRERESDESTFNHWKGTTAGSRIDFILYTAELTPLEAEIVRTNYGGRFPSDHYPVTASLRLNGNQ